MMEMRVLVKIYGRGLDAIKTFSFRSTHLVSDVLPQVKATLESKPGYEAPCDTKLALMYRNRVRDDDLNLASCDVAEGASLLVFSQPLPFRPGNYEWSGVLRDIMTQSHIIPTTLKLPQFPNAARWCKPWKGRPGESAHLPYLTQIEAGDVCQSENDIKGKRAHCETVRAECVTWFEQKDAMLLKFQEYKERCPALVLQLNKDEEWFKTKAIPHVDDILRATMRCLDTIKSSFKLYPKFSHHLSSLTSPSG